MPGLSTVLYALAVVAFLLVVIGVGLGHIPLVALGLLFIAGGHLADHLGYGVHHDHPNDPMRLVMPPSVSVR